jgi:hypothetical protein
MRAIRTIIVGAVLAGGLAGSAHAQDAKAPADTPMQVEEQTKRRDVEAIDRQYKATLQRTRGGGSTTAAPVDDPWSNMRGGNDAKPKR